MKTYFNKGRHMTGQLKTTPALLGLIILGFSATTVPSFAQDSVPNSAPVCKAKTEVIKPLPGDLDLGAFSIDPIKLSPACTDADDDKLSLTSVSSPATIDPNYGIHISQAPAPGQTLVLDFTVSDGNGGTASSTLTIIRQ
jgi:hypothetical protein